LNFEILYLDSVWNFIINLNLQNITKFKIIYQSNSRVMRRFVFVFDLSKNEVLRMVSASRFWSKSTEMFGKARFSGTIYYPNIGYC